MCIRDSLYTDDFNRRVLQKAFDDADVAYAPLFDARVHVFVGEHHPLAGKALLRPDDLADYPRYSFEQGTTNSFYYSEEPLSHLPHKRNIRISYRGTLTNLLTSYNGYTPVSYTHLEGRDGSEHQVPVPPTHRFDDGGDDRAHDDHVHRVDRPSQADGEARLLPEPLIDDG